MKPDDEEKTQLVSFKTKNVAIFSVSLSFSSSVSTLFDSILKEKDGQLNKLLGLSRE